MRDLELIEIREVNGGDAVEGAAEGAANGAQVGGTIGGATGAMIGAAIGAVAGAIRGSMATPGKQGAESAPKFRCPTY